MNDASSGGNVASNPTCAVVARSHNANAER